MISDRYAECVTGNCSVFALVGKAWTVMPTVKSGDIIILPVRGPMENTFFGPAKDHIATSDSRMPCSSTIPFVQESL